MRSGSVHVVGVVSCEKRAMKALSWSESWMTSTMRLRHRNCDNLTPCRWATLQACSLLDLASATKGCTRTMPVLPRVVGYVSSMLSNKR